jgi:hypothetical protein
VVQDGEVLVGDVEIILGATPLPAGDWQGTD